MADTESNINVSDQDDISFKKIILNINQWYSYILSKWVVILLAGVIGATLGFTYAYFKKPIYKANLSFALEDDKSGGGSLNGALGLASQFGFDLGGNSGGAFSGDNLIELMRSRTMVEKTLLSTVVINNKKQSLAEYYIAFNDLRKGWSKDAKLKEIHYLPEADRSSFSLQQDSVLGVIYTGITKNNLSVDKLDKKLSIINLKVSSDNEIFAKLFVEILAKTVSDFYIDTKIKRSKQNVDILERQTDSVRNALYLALAGFASSADANPNPNPALQVLKVPSQRRQVEIQANTAILTELVKNLEISKVSLRKETPLIQVIDQPILPLEKEKFGRLKGMVIGAFLLGFLTTLFLITKKIYRSLMAT